jgi:hypothetical protein
MDIGNRKFGKSSVSVSQKVLPEGAGGSIYATEIVQGIHRYMRIAGAVYSVYRTTTHKYIGLALYDGKEFKECDVQTLIKALESKDRK